MVKPEDGALPSSMIGQLQQHLSFPGAAGEDADGEDGDDLSDGDGDGDDDGSGGDDDGDGRGGNRGGGGSGNNRVGGGAGKRLTYEELQAKFGMGLKEAAAALGICATTLKRACRRHGIRRWPRRQIAKINRALNQQLQVRPYLPLVMPIIHLGITLPGMFYTCHAALSMAQAFACKSVTS